METSRISIRLQNVVAEIRLQLVEVTCCLFSLSASFPWTQDASDIHRFYTWSGACGHEVDMSENTQICQSLCHIYAKPQDKNEYTT